MRDQGQCGKRDRKCKKAWKGDNIDEIKTAIEALTQASHKLAELMYAQATKDNPDAGGGAAGRRRFPSSRAKQPTKETTMWSMPISKK